jgi:hypothetical protein
MAASPEALAEVLVEPEGLDWEDSAADSPAGTTRSPEDEAEHDPLLELFRTGATLSKEQFLLELEKHQLAVPGRAPELSLSEPSIHQRREPRIAVALPVQVWGYDARQESFHQTTSVIDVSHRGARIGGAPFQLKAGDVVHLVSGGQDARFRVIWVGEPGTPQEGQVGLQSLTTDK